MEISSPRTTRSSRSVRTLRTGLERVLRSGASPSLASLCPRCGRAGIKVGTRRTGLGPIQRFFCRTCKRHFGAAPIPRRRYSAKTILEALTAYNLGHTIADAKAKVARAAKVPASTLHSWIGQFASVCTFTRFRRRYSLSPDDVIFSKTFDHKQEYKFAIHRFKTNVLCKRLFPEIRRYLWRISEHCPNQLFQASDGARCSDGNLPNLELRLVAKETNAQALAKLGLLLARRAKDRHPAIQHFMLVNDSATVAVEVPVYLHPHEAPDLGLNGVLTGHIDVLQIRGNRVWILDYKPDARRERHAKYQLYLYARALSVRTGVPLSRFAMAYFDDKDYFEVHLPSRSNLVR